MIYLVNNNENMSNIFFFNVENIIIVGKYFGNGKKYMYIIIYGVIVLSLWLFLW